MLDRPDKKLMAQIALRSGKGTGNVGPQIFEASAGVRCTHPAAPLSHNHVDHLIPAEATIEERLV
jgi:hypothetical protein